MLEYFSSENINSLQLCSDLCDIFGSTYTNVAVPPRLEVEAIGLPAVISITILSFLRITLWNINVRNLYHLSGMGS